SRRADALGDLAVAHRLADRDLSKGLPDALLERRAAQVERQVETDGGRLDEADDLGDQRLEHRIAADEAGLRKAVLKRAGQRIRVVAEQDGADAALAAGDQDRAERTFADGEADLRVGAARAIVGRSHAENRIGRLVEPAVGVEAGAVDRRGHRSVGARELVADAPRALRARIGLRRQAGHRLEDAVEIEGAHAGLARQRFERRYLLRRLDDPTDLGDKG